MSMLKLVQLKQMPHQNAYELTCLAVARKELDKLLLGVPPYRNGDSGIFADGPADPFDTYERGIIVFAQSHPDINMRSMVMEAADRLCESEAGREVVRAIAFCEEYGGTHELKSITLGIDPNKLRHVADEMERLSPHQAPPDVLPKVTGEQLRLPGF